jgi:hypothetical protein
MADNTNIMITVTADDSGAIKSINKLGQEINTAGDASKAWIKQLSEIKTQLGQLDPNSQQWAALALQYKELGGSSKVVSQSTEELKSKLEAFGNNLPVEQTKTLKQQIRELQNTLTSGKIEQGTDQYKQLAAQLSDLKDRQKDFNEEIGANAGSAVESTSNNLNLLKDRLLSLDFEGAAVSAKSLAGNISSLDFAKVGQGVGSLGKAFGAIGKALLTNPIFLLAGAIGAAIAYSDELFSLVDGISAADEEALNAQKEKATFAQKQLDAVGAQENILRLQGKSEREILDLKIAAGKVAINEQKALITTLELQKTQQIEAAERNRDILKGLLNFVSLPLTALLAGVDLLTEKLNAVGLIGDETFAKFGNLRDKFTTSVAELVFNPADVAKEGQNTIDEAKKTLAQLENQQAGFQLSIKAIDQKAADDRQAAADKANADKLAADQKAADERTKTAEDEAERLRKIEEKKQLDAEEAAKKKADFLAQSLANELDAGKTARQKELDAIRAQLEPQIAALEENGKSAANLRGQLRQSESDINKKYDDADAATRDANAKKEEDRLKALKAARIQTAQDAINTLLSLNEAFTGKSEKAQKAAFNRSKAIQIAQASINTYQSATAAYGSQLTVGDVTSPVRATIAAAIAVAAGLANVAKIAKTTYNSPAPSGGGSNAVGGGGDLANTGVATTGGAPEFNPLATLGLQNQPAQVTPAYVLASDIASSMEARSKVTDLSRL